jgi:hypothetical protein
LWYLSPVCGSRPGWSSENILVDEVGAKLFLVLQEGRCGEVVLAMLDLQNVLDKDIQMS